MNRIHCLVTGLALSLVFVGVGAGSLAREKPGKPQDGPRTSIVDELWQQMGQLQRQIIRLEAGDNPRVTPRSEPLPDNIAHSLLDNAPQRRLEETPRDAQKREPAQKTVLEREKPPQLGESTKEARIDQLWRQITALQKAILKLEVAELNPRLFASATPAANGTDRTERHDIASTRNSERPFGNGDEKRESPNESLPAQYKPLQPRGGANAAQIGQLWQQISQLYKQIVALEVGDARSH